MSVPIDPDHEQSLTFQSYEPGASIEGVRRFPLTRHRALEGSFMEYLRLSDGLAEGIDGRFDVRQISFSWAGPGRINAFHLHPKAVRDELWCVVAGELLVWLVDVRAGSATLNVKSSFVLSGEGPTMLYIPSGVAHGYKAGPCGATLVYAMNGQFDAADPNEGRLPWDHFGSEIWEEDRG